MDLFSLFFFYGFVSAAQSVLLYVFLGKLTGKMVRMRRKNFVIYLLFFYLMLATEEFFSSSLVSAALELLLLYGICRLQMKNNPALSGLAAILAVSVMQLCFGTLNSITFLLSPHIDIAIQRSYVIPMLSSILALSLCFFCYYFISQHFSLQEDGSTSFIFMLLAPVLFFFAIGFYITNTSYGNISVIPIPVEWQKHLELLVIQLLGFLSLFSTLYAYRRICESFLMKARLALLEQETCAQKIYVEEAKSRYDLTKAFRHDIKNHLTVLSGLLRTGNWGQALQYLDKLSFMTSDLSFPSYTGNPVVDILLGSKLELAGMSGVEVDIHLSLPSPCAVDDLDLCILFSNALDNAILACSRVNGPGKIHITGERQGDFYMIEFENSCLPELSYKEKPGTGISNMKAVAEKYGGAVSIEREPPLFRLNILLNISIQPDRISVQNT